MRLPIAAWTNEAVATRAFKCSQQEDDDRLEKIEDYQGISDVDLQRMLHIANALASTIAAPE